MKTIKISDEDYKTLMELSKELQEQDNHGNAFPYFWEPRSKKLEVNIHNEGSVTRIYHDGEMYSPKSLAEYDDELWEEFITKECDLLWNEQCYSEDYESEWIAFIDCKSDWEYQVWTEDWKQSTDHNPSLFLSDVQNYCKTNTHHLGRDPGTYARTIWRMPKMEALVKAVYRLNPQPKKNINHEALRFVYPKKDNKND